MTKTIRNILPTAMFAAAHSVKGETVRARLSITGSYYGIRPTKLASGRLLWPDVQVVADSGRSEK